MSISIACTQCGTTIKAPDEAAGKKGRCPKCKAVILIPELDDFVEPDEDFVEPEPESFETETLPTPAQDSVGFVKIKDNVAGEYGLDEGDEFERQHRMQEKRREADQSYDDSRERRRK
jgi:DNA-directed RNA polymerase subunit RPC12/RpoP